MERWIEFEAVVRVLADDEQDARTAVRECVLFCEGDEDAASGGPFVKLGDRVRDPEEIVQGVIDHLNRDS